jgi:hypothetical protein
MGTISNEARQLRGLVGSLSDEVLTFTQNRESEMGKDQLRIRYRVLASRLEVVS